MTHRQYLSQLRNRSHCLRPRLRTCFTYNQSSVVVYADELGHIRTSPRSAPSARMASGDSHLADTNFNFKIFQNIIVKHLGQCNFWMLPAHTGLMGKSESHMGVSVNLVEWKFSPGAIRPPTTGRLAPVQLGTKL